MKGICPISSSRIIFCIYRDLDKMFFYNIDISSQPIIFSALLAECMYGVHLQLDKSPFFSRSPSPLPVSIAVFQLPRPTGQERAKEGSGRRGGYG